MVGGQPLHALAQRARVAAYRAAGVDLPILFPMPVGGDWGYEKTIAAMAGKAMR